MTPNLSPEAQARCNATKQANDLVAQIGKLMLSEAAALPSDHARQVFWSAVHKAAALRLVEKPACLVQAKPSPATSPPAGQSPREPDPDVAHALEIIEWILTNYADVPSRGQDFAESVADQARSMRETIERTGRVTERQADALDNMQGGIANWLER